MSKKHSKFKKLKKSLNKAEQKKWRAEMPDRSLGIGVQTPWYLLDVQGKLGHF